MIAVDEGFCDIVVLLLQAGANPNIESNNGSTALWMALWDHYKNKDDRSCVIKALEQNTGFF